MITSICEMSACELVHAAKSKKIKTSEIAEAFLQRCKEIDPEIGAWEHLDKDVVYSQVESLPELDKINGLGSLYGVPIGVKDVFNTLEYPNEMGSNIWKGYRPNNDARVIHSIRSNSGLIFGKTVTAEFAVDYLALNKTKNPHNPLHIPGTSSTGSAAAIAARMVPLALGTQTAGSIIRPASYCGVIGFKPTFGLIPRTGVLKTTDSMDTIGIFANTVDDVKLLFDSIRVRGKDYPFVNQYLDLKEDPPKSIQKTIKVGVLVSGIDVFKDYEPYSVESVMGLANMLSKIEGLQVDLFTPPSEWSRIHESHRVIYDASLNYYFKQEHGQAKSQISNTLMESINRGKKVSVEKYKKTLDFQAEIRNSANHFLQQFDVLITPAVAGEPPCIGAQEKPDTCLIWTFLGMPVITLPLFKGPLDLPFGLQIIGCRYSDYKLLDVAKYIRDCVVVPPS
jgi:Asp-tRNA(Asn)/Glu-tRNA(Gln) amidotransferase A subunit family amidase